MALDKLVDSAQLNADLTSVANAIRTKGGTSASLAFPSGFVSAVEAISSGGGGNGEYKRLYRIQTTEAVHAVKIDFDQAWELLDVINIVIHTPTDYNDWVYIAYDSTYSSSYAEKNVKDLKYLVVKVDTKWRRGEFNSAPYLPNTSAVFPTYAYFYLYTGSANFPIGTTFEVYGGYLDESI